MARTKTLHTPSADKLARAGKFIDQTGRPLERALYAQQFAHGSDAAVIAAHLRPYAMLLPSGFLDHITIIAEVSRRIVARHRGAGHRNADRSGDALARAEARLNSSALRALVYSALGDLPAKRFASRVMCA
jgi:hypothetical protein